MLRQRVRLNNGAEDSFWLATHLLRRRSQCRQRCKFFGNLAEKWNTTGGTFEAHWAGWFLLASMTHWRLTTKITRNWKENGILRVGFFGGTSPSSTSWQRSSVQRITFRSCRYAQGRLINGYPGVPCITAACTQCIINTLSCILVYCISVFCIFLLVTVGT